MYRDIISKIAELYKELGLEKNDFIGNILFLKCETTDEQFVEILNRVYEFTLSKSKSNKKVKSSDIWRFSKKIKVKMGLSRYQILPFHMFVRYIGETDDDIKQNEIYNVGVVYYKDINCKKEMSYLITLNDNLQKEYSVELFEKLTPSKVMFIGVSEENIPHTDGLEVGKVYEVERVYGNKIYFTNGQSCIDYEVDILEFVQLNA